MNQHETAILGGGCFWGVQTLFDQTHGVIDTQVGYCGGSTTQPSYQDVCGGDTGHAEVIKIVFDPSIICYRALLELFFKHHDPTTLNRQGPDIGTQYRSVIFYQTDEQQKIAKSLIEDLQKSTFKQPIVTQVVPTKPFYPAEAYHQKYLEKRGQSHCSIGPKTES